MERCNTCPHWIPAPEDGDEDRMCALSEHRYGTPIRHPLTALSSNGGHEWLVTAPDFGCTEHPGNR